MKILLAEKDPELRLRAAECLSREGFEVIQANDGLAAAAGVAREGIGLVLLDLELEGLDVPEFISKVRQGASDLPIAILANGSPPEKVALALAAGACRCLRKEKVLEDLVGCVKEILRTQGKDPFSCLEAEQLQGVDRLIGSSPAVFEISKLIHQYAASPASTVLIQGENGTGKDLVAGIIHEVSARASMRFVDITCTSLQETLLESELFGHEKGAFTDAKARKRGLFELADGGTIFMNEIGDMSPLLQAKVLRALEEKAFRRVGGTEDLRVNVRVIAATNQNLKDLVRRKKFREDLYYRLNILEIDIPPLRERREDIAPLLEHFHRRFARDSRKEPTEVSRELIGRLESYSWPGNVRQLRNAVEKAVLLSQGDMPNWRGLPREILMPDPSLEPIPSGEILPLEEVERRHISTVLSLVKGNQQRASKLLGINRGTLRLKMKKHGLGVRPQPVAATE